MAIVKLTADETAGKLGHVLELPSSKINEMIDQVNVNTAALAGATDPFNYVGNIALPADFPAAPTEGHVYLCTADVIDNDATKTNTGQHFFKGSIIVWDGTSAWMDSNPEETGVVSLVATPYTVADGIHTVLVQTAVIAGPSVVNLPTALAQRVGRKITVINQDSAAMTYPISVTPQGADQIDNIAAAMDIDVADGAMEFLCGAVGQYYTEPSTADLAIHAALTTLAHGYVVSEPVAIDLKVAGNNVITLPALVGQHFLPVAAYVLCSAGVALNADAQLSFGTTPGGREIMAPFPMAGLNAAGQAFMVSLTGLFVEILGNATPDCTVEVMDSGTSGTIQVGFIGIVL